MLHFEPSLDALSLRSDVISSTTTFFSFLCTANPGTCFTHMNLDHYSFIVVGRKLIRARTKINQGRNPVYKPEFI